MSIEHLRTVYATWDKALDTYLATAAAAGCDEALEPGRAIKLYGAKVMTQVEAGTLDVNEFARVMRHKTDVLERIILDFIHNHRE